MKPFTKSLKTIGIAAAFAGASMVATLPAAAQSLSDILSRVQQDSQELSAENTQRLEQFRRDRHVPATVIVIEITEMYTQCARAMLRAGIWTAGDESGSLPTVGEILAEQTGGEEGGVAYDDAWDARARKTMWSDA